MMKSLKQKLLIAFEHRGWYRHVKERKNYLGRDILATKGSFFRNDKDNAWLYMLSRHYSNILDIGCNIGQSTMLMIIGTSNRVVCVDPNPKALSYCAENMIFNDLSKHVTFINAFVGDEDGKEIPFYTIGTGAAGSMFSEFAKTARQHSQSFMVKTRTVSSICIDLVFKPDFIKIDVEGAEQLVMNGISDKILGDGPVIFVEIHSGKDINIVENTNGILKWCETKRYKAYYLRNHAPLNVKEVSTRGRYHALLIPENLEYPEYLKNIPENSSLTSLSRT